MGLIAMAVGLCLCVCTEARGTWLVARRGGACALLGRRTLSAVSAVLHLWARCAGCSLDATWFLGCLRWGAGGDARCCDGECAWKRGGVACGRQEWAQGTAHATGMRDQCGHSCRCVQRCSRLIIARECTIRFSETVMFGYLLTGSCCALNLAVACCSGHPAWTHPLVLALCTSSSKHGGLQCDRTPRGSSLTSRGWPRQSSCSCRTSFAV